MGHRTDPNSLQRRLLLLIFAISTAALLTFMLGLLALQYMNGRAHVISSHQVLASVVSNSSAAALTFDDRTVAFETLSRLRTVPSVDFAAIFGNDGSQFVRYVRTEELGSEVPLTYPAAYARAPFFANGKLFVAAPIIADRRVIGRLVMGINLAEQRARALQTIGLALLLTLLLCLAAYLSSRIAVRKVTKPVESLSEVVRRVSERQDYSERAEVFHKDEIGALAHGFNAMLKKVQERDAELSEHRANLERVVEERTQQLNERNEALTAEIAERSKVQADLVHAKELAEQASEAKSEFLANISHEIRTPLNAVVGLSDLLARTELTPRQTRFVDSIRNAGQSLLALINDILDFSKSEVGGMALHEDDVDLRTLATEAGSFLGGLAQQKGLALVVELDEEVPERVRADAVRVRQILVNLVNNAIKFTEQGKVTVALTFEHSGAQTGILRLTVSDTGIGIADNDLQRIFNAFEQVDSSATRSAGGTGLGLAITRKLVDAMGGSITVESTIGSGSRFTVALPLTRSTSDTTLRQEARDVFASVPVLIAAAIANDGTLVEAFVSGWGMKPSITSRSEAVATLARAAQGGKPFGLLICDFGQQHSLQLLHELRNHPAIAYTPVLLLCPSPSDYEVLSTLEDRHAGVLSKPLTQSGLQNRIREMLEHREASLAASGDALPQYALQVLLTEDNATNRVVAIENLSSLGCQIDVAVDGLQAVEAFQNKRYDLIFMDCQMPKLDGFGATQRIRDLEGQSPSRRTPIVALTAHAMAGDREKCLANGMDDYLIKPFRLEDMSTCLERWCPGARLAAVANTPAAGARPAQPENAPAQQPAGSSIFDEAHVENLRRKKPGLWRALKTAFLAEAGAARDGLVLALESRDWATARLVAHTMKSAAANVGATALSETSKALEKAAKAEDLESCTRHAAAFQTLLHAVCAAMENDTRPAASGGQR